MLPARLLFASLLLAVVANPLAAAAWATKQGDSTDLPGKHVTVTADGKVVARLIYGSGQQMPYLAVYDEQERLVTNPGLDKAGNEVGHEPHHRGLFLGWQKVQSDLGVANMWSMREGTRMQVVEIEKVSTTKTGATIVARIEWRAGKKDAQGNDLLLTETRSLTVSRPAPNGTTQVDLSTRFKAARDLKLDGDVQHAGVHVRVADLVSKEPAKNSYLWSPDVPGVPGKVISTQLQWGEFIFPLHGSWYSFAQLNAPGNPVEEFSTREYGRFGYFFKRDLQRNDTLALNYRFLLKSIPTPASAPKRSAAELAAARRDIDAAYAGFRRESKK